jgi:hypothetical protein
MMIFTIISTSNAFKTFTSTPGTIIYDETTLFPTGFYITTATSDIIHCSDDQLVTCQPKQIILTPETKTGSGQNGVVYQALESVKVNIINKDGNIVYFNEFLMDEGQGMGESDFLVNQNVDESSDSFSNQFTMQFIFTHYTGIGQHNLPTDQQPIKLPSFFPVQSSIIFNTIGEEGEQNELTQTSSITFSNTNTSKKTPFETKHRPVFAISEDDTQQFHFFLQNRLLSLSTKNDQIMKQNDPFFEKNDQNNDWVSPDPYFNWDNSPANSNEVVDVNYTYSIITTAPVLQNVQTQAPPLAVMWKFIRLPKPTAISSEIPLSDCFLNHNIPINVEISQNGLEMTTKITKTGQNGEKIEQHVPFLQGGSIIDPMLTCPYIKIALTANDGTIGPQTHPKLYQDIYIQRQISTSTPNNNKDNTSNQTTQLSTFLYNLNFYSGSHPLRIYSLTSANTVQTPYPAKVFDPTQGLTKDGEKWQNSIKLYSDFSTASLLSWDITYPIPKGDNKLDISQHFIRSNAFASFSSICTPIDNKLAFNPNDETPNDSNESTFVPNNGCFWAKYFGMDTSMNIARYESRYDDINQINQDKFQYDIVNQPVILNLTQSGSKDVNTFPQTAVDNQISTPVAINTTSKPCGNGSYRSDNTHYTECLSFSIQDAEKAALKKNSINESTHSSNRFLLSYVDHLWYDTWINTAPNWLDLTLELPLTNLLTGKVEECEMYFYTTKMNLNSSFLLNNLTTESNNVIQQRGPGMKWSEYKQFNILIDDAIGNESTADKKVNDKGSVSQNSALSPLNFGTHSINIVLNPDNNLPVAFQSLILHSQYNTITFHGDAPTCSVYPYDHTKSDSTQTQPIQSVVVFSAPLVDEKTNNLYKSLIISFESPQSSALLLKCTGAYIDRPESKHMAYFPIENILFGYSKTKYQNNNNDFILTSSQVIGFPLRYQVLGAKGFPDVSHGNYWKRSDGDTEGLFQFTRSMEIFSKGLGPVLLITTCCIAIGMAMFGFSSTYGVEVPKLN